jgi:MFS family permease
MLVAQPRSVIRHLVLFVLIAFTAQQVLFPSLPPLSRRVGLTELQLGAIISVAAATLVVTAPTWGRLVARVGYRRVLALGLESASVALIGFALVCQVVLERDGGAGTIGFGAMLLTRGPLFGLVPVVPVAAIAYVAAHTSDPDERTAEIGRLDTVQGAAILLGPGSGRSADPCRPARSDWAAPVLVGLSWIGVLLIPKDHAPARELGRSAVRAGDPRIWPYLFTGFTLFLSMGLVLLTVGFLLHDRDALSPTEAARATGAVTFASGLTLPVPPGRRVGRGPGLTAPLRT